MPPPGPIAPAPAPTPHPLDRIDPAHLPTGATAALRLAHELREACHAAWSTEPQRAVQAAALIRQLLAAAAGGPSAAPAPPTPPPPPTPAQGAEPQPLSGEGGRDDPAAARAEIAALADWCDGIAAVTRSRLEPALAHLQAATSALHRLSRPLLAAQAQVPQVMVLAMLGRHAQAAEVGAQAAAELARQGDGLSAAKVALNLGSLHLYQDAYAKAAEQYREAAVRFARAGDVEHSVMADIGLGDALVAVGDLAEAGRIYDRAAMRARAHGLPVLQALVDESAALLALAQGRFAEALQGLESARLRFQRLGMESHQANLEQHLGDAYLELRLLPEAVRLLDQAWRRLQALDLPDEQAWTQLRRSRALAALGRLDDAQAALGAAHRLFGQQQGAVGLGHVSLASSAMALARNQPQDALRWAREARESMHTSGQSDGLLHADVAEAEALLAMGEHESAAQRFEHALQLAEQHQRLPLRVQCHTGLGLIDERQGRRAAARRRFLSAVDQFEALRQALPGDELRSSFMADHLRPYDALVRLALAAAQPCEAAADFAEGSHAPTDAGHQSDGASRHATEVLVALERSRARAMSERLGPAAPSAGVRAADGGASGAPTDPASDSAARSQRARLHWLYGRQRRLQAEGGSSDRLDQEIRRAEQALLTAHRQAELRATPGPGTSDGDAQVRTVLSSLSERLAADEALVAFGISDDELFACVLRGGRLQVVRHLARWSDTLQAAQGLQFQLGSLREGAHRLQDHLPLLTQRIGVRLQHLYRCVWQNLEPVLSGARRLLVVPAGELAQWPHAAILAQRPPAPAPAPAAAAETPPARAERHRSGHGDPMGERDRPGKTAPGQGPVPIVSLVGSLRLALRGLDRPMAPLRQVLALGDDRQLAQAEAEARAVAAEWPGGAVLLGPKARREALLSRAGQTDLLHLACHAVFRHDSPLFSSLHLADGPLTAEQVQQLRLPPQLVVLSACETALGDPRRGDERFGLVRAFLSAGAARVVASLWPVDDAATRHFMAHFHAALRAGQGAAEALASAQQAQRQSHPHPFFWAGFTLHGGW